MNTTITVDQFVAAEPEKVWRTLTEPELLARWWAAGDISAELGHKFHLDMPGWGSQPCEVVESTPFTRFVYTFTENWTLAWTLTKEGSGTRLILEHSGFDPDDRRSQDAFTRMGPGWRNQILPKLAEIAAQLD